MIRVNSDMDLATESKINLKKKLKEWKWESQHTVLRSENTRNYSK